MAADFCGLRDGEALHEPTPFATLLSRSSGPRGRSPAIRERHVVLWAAIVIHKQAFQTAVLRGDNGR
jgi:hypothetical protein